MFHPNLLLILLLAALFCSEKKNNEPREELWHQEKHPLMNFRPQKRRNQRASSSIYFKFLRIQGVRERRSTSQQKKTNAFLRMSKQAATSSGCGCLLNFLRVYLYRPVPSRQSPPKNNKSSIRMRETPWLYFPSSSAFSAFSSSLLLSREF